MLKQLPVLLVEQVRGPRLLLQLDLHLLLLAVELIIVLLYCAQLTHHRLKLVVEELHLLHLLLLLQLEVQHLLLNLLQNIGLVGHLIVVVVAVRRPQVAVALLELALAGGPQIVGWPS